MFVAASMCFTTALLAADSPMTHAMLLLMTSPFVYLGSTHVQCRSRVCTFKLRKYLRGTLMLLLLPVSLPAVGSNLVPSLLLSTAATCSPESTPRPRLPSSHAVLWNPVSCPGPVCAYWGAGRPLAWVLCLLSVLSPWLSSSGETAI